MIEFVTVIRNHLVFHMIWISQNQRATVTESFQQMLNSYFINMSKVDHALNTLKTSMHNITRFI